MEVHRRSVGPLRVAAVPIPGLRSVASLFALEAGQWSEPRGRAGAALLVAQTLLRGTLARDADAWAAAL
ncbi:MAG: insulinase family protein, partial [Chloroflexota bacterium]